MKKNLFIAAAALATLASCAKVENEVPTQGSEISFKAINYKNNPTKGTGAINSTAYPTDLPFGVFAYYLGDGKTWAADGASASEFMNDVKVSFDGTDIYKPAQTYYWPLQGSLTFVGYSPATLNADYDIATKTLSIEDYVVPAVSEGVVTGQDDVMFTLAKDAANKTQNEKEYTGSTKGVQMMFRHALSQIRFIGATAEDYSAVAKYYITNITVKNALNKGSFELVNDADRTHANWTAAEPASKADYEAYYDAAYVADNTKGGTEVKYSEYTALGSYVLLMPQEIADELVIEVTYRMESAKIEDNGTISGYFDAGHKTATVVVNNGVTSFEPNKIYNMYLKLKADEILFAPQIESWDSPVEDVVYPSVK